MAHAGLFPFLRREVSPKSGGACTGESRHVSGGQPQDENPVLFGVLNVQACPASSLIFTSFDDGGGGGWRRRGGGEAGRAAGGGRPHLSLASNSLLIPSVPDDGVVPGATARRPPPAATALNVQGTGHGREASWPPADPPAAPPPPTASPIRGGRPRHYRPGGRYRWLTTERPVDRRRR